MQPRILKKGEVKERDYDLWAQCYQCGDISPLYEAIQEPEIKDSEETIQNPFENESIFQKAEQHKEGRAKNLKVNGLKQKNMKILKFKHN